MNKNKSQTETRKRRSRPLRWFGYVCLLLLIVGGGVVVLFRHTPSAYRPEPVSHPEQVSPYLTHKLGPDFINQVQLNEPFELLIEQEGLNDIISRQDWVEEFDEFSFTDPVILLYADTIRLMGTLDYKGISSVVTVIAQPRMNPDGTIWLNIQSIRLGVVPVTKLVGVLARNAFEQSRDYFVDQPQLEQIVDAAVRNEPFQPVFDIDGQTVRITGMTLSPQQLQLTIKPE